MIAQWIFRLNMIGILSKIILVWHVCIKLYIDINLPYTIVMEMYLWSTAMKSMVCHRVSYLSMYKIRLRFAKKDIHI